MDTDYRNLGIVIALVDTTPSSGPAVLENDLFTTIQESQLKFGEDYSDRMSVFVSTHPEIIHDVLHALHARPIRRAKAAS